MGTRRPDCPEYYPHSINNTKGPKFPDCFACECYTEMELTPGNPYERELRQMDMVTATSFALRVMYEQTEKQKRLDAIKPLIENHQVKLPQYDPKWLDKYLTETEQEKLKLAGEASRLNGLAAKNTLEKQARQVMWIGLDPAKPPRRWYSWFLDWFRSC